MEIAVFLNEDGKTIRCNESGVVNIYIKDRERWKIIKKVPLDISNINDTGIMCKKFIAMAESLSKCKIFIAAEVKEIFYTILDGRGFNIWSIQGAPEDFLEYVLKREEEEHIEEISIEEAPIPVETEKLGNYYIDLRPVMESEKISSKKVLLPFLRNATFNELEVDCSHVPPWFGYELENLKLDSEVESISEGAVKVRIYHR